MTKSYDSGIIVELSDQDMTLLEDFRKREGVEGNPMGVGEAAAMLLAEGLHYHMLSLSRSRP
jgi:hypothetical protein